MKQPPQDLKAIVQGRLDSSAPDRAKSRQAIAKGKPFEAEADPERAVAYTKRLLARSASPSDEARKILTGAERVQGRTVDFVDAFFLHEGSRVARAVGCIYSDGGRSAIGTGFLVAPGLLMTNQHVLLDEGEAAGAEVEFDFETTFSGAAVSPTRFRLDPGSFFLRVDYTDLDFAVVAVGDRIRGPAALSDMGYCPLSGRDDKHAVGMPVNIIQHPNGRPKQIVIRRNDLVARAERVLHYESDTADGASGSPVFNDFWEIIALHHWAEPYLDRKNEDGVEVPITVNEGVRASRIADRLRELASTLPADKGGRVLAALALDRVMPSIPDRPTEERRGPEMWSEPAPERKTAMSNGNPGSAEATIVIPLEVRFRFKLPQDVDSVETRVEQEVLERAGGPERVWIDRHYSNREGYDREFLSISVPMPTLSQAQRADVAALVAGETAAASGVLKYEHFSVVLSGSRRLAYYTATNIDGSTYIRIDRDTGLPVEVGPEGETWYDDTRMSIADTIRKAWYGDHSNLYDRGHLTRRNDPTWGTESTAVRANADTFHWSNCSPQHWRFNQSTKYWQGVERHYLEHGARVDRERITVFSGPVLANGDPITDGVQIPMQFWKVVVRVVDNALAVTGFLVDQKPLVDSGEVRRYLGRPSDDGPPPQVDQFKVSIDEIENLTGLRFAAAVRNADTFVPAGPEGGETRGRVRIKSWGDLD